jgi:hypothetical protein
VAQRGPPDDDASPAGSQWQEAPRLLDAMVTVLCATHDCARTPRATPVTASSMS